jgi:hypothetical protein
MHSTQCEPINLTQILLFNGILIQILRFHLIYSLYEQFLLLTEKSNSISLKIIINNSNEK